MSRSRPFGVITTSGRAVASSACRRSRWKYWPAVVQFAIRMFSCAASCRKRSSFALSARGRSPRSRAGGAGSGARSAATSRARRRGTGRSTICAPFTKSPNCASQSTRESAPQRSSRTRSRGTRTPKAASCRSRTTPPLRGDAGSDVHLAGARVVEHRMPVGERAALGVLAGEPDGIPSVSRLADARASAAPIDPAVRSISRRRSSCRAASRSPRTRRVAQELLVQRA